MAVEAHVTFGGENASPVGRERIRLLEEVGRAGSISGAARAVGAAAGRAPRGGLW